MNQESNKQAIASFTISIQSAENGTWQGTIAHNGASHQFESEMQMLLLMMELAPELKPSVDWQ